MTNDKLKFIFQQFWESNFNKAVLIVSVLFSMVAFTWGWITPIVMVLWLVTLIRAKDFRKEYRNKTWLLIFLFIAIGWNTYWDYFFLGVVAISLMLIVPEHSWNYFGRFKK